MLYAICIGLFSPLISFLILMSGSNFLSRRVAGLISCLAIFISFACFSTLLAFYTYHDPNPEVVTLFKWIPIEGINADFSLLLDPLSLVMTLIITGVGFLIHVYSVGYMEHEIDYARYFGFLNFFVFSMLLLVLAGNLLLLFVGWEGVGLASYLLIGFWYNRPAAAQAATKAFVINRIGDCGLLLGLLLTFYTFGTGDITEITQRVGHEFVAGAPLLTLITFLYFVGATGKSAQLPLYSWLPDAMEGPTPVSALIHAATMVTAGVYLIVRMHAVFTLAPLTLQIVGVIGAVTALFASLCALAQTDLKRVLAFSTVSQLGLMFLACGAGAFYSAMFHLTTHAFVKALLFLSAGNVVHMLHDETQMAKMGGLTKIFTKTHWMFLIGALALSGIPPFATFFSKDLILEQEYLSGFEVLFYIGLAASILTGVYMMRAYCLTFLGENKVDIKLLKTVKEAPAVMLIPVSILAVLAIIGGFLGFSYGRTPILESFLVEIGITPIEKALSDGSLFTKEAWMAIGGAVGAVGLTTLAYTLFAKNLTSPIVLFKKAFFVNEIYDWVFVYPLAALSWVIAYILEPKVFSRSIDVLAHGTQAVASGLQEMQSGQIRSYVAWMVLGSVALVVYLTT